MTDKQFLAGPDMNNIQVKKSTGILGDRTMGDKLMYPPIMVDIINIMYGFKLVLHSI